ncbi:hypothetical protein SAMN02743940_1721 [Nitrosomonas cryotolerans ATCC 49181]|uniref:Uncharacterized protein n=1 Tax=Nitrosomonas cryotolerans ATCC 49181 TaxID=1131553 RepID=A0A1N6ID25_9PROT|nr:hypothetical protein SAMN02743940_1721 [Nitrosomonas cryotolerans ATCC 49181]
MSLCRSRNHLMANGRLNGLPSMFFCQHTQSYGSMIKGVMEMVIDATLTEYERYRIYSSKENS